MLTLEELDSDTAEEIASLLEDGFDMDPNLWDWFVFDLHPECERFIRERFPRDFDQEYPGHRTLVIYLGNDCYSRMVVMDPQSVTREKVSVA